MGHPAWKLDLAVTPLLAAIVEALCDQTAATVCAPSDLGWRPGPAPRGLEGGAGRDRAQLSDERPYPMPPKLSQGHGNVTIRALGLLTWLARRLVAGAPTGWLGKSWGLLDCRAECPHNQKGGNREAPCELHHCGNDGLRAPVAGGNTFEPSLARTNKPNQYLYLNKECCIRKLTRSRRSRRTPAQPIIM